MIGSVARGDDRLGSDIDIMIEIDPDARITVFDYVDLKDYIARLFDQPVDVVNRESLNILRFATADYGGCHLCGSERTNSARSQ